MDHQTETIVKLIQSSDPLQDDQALAAARTGLSDYIASSLAAVQESAVAKLRDYVAREQGPATLIGANIWVTAQNAALFNGFQAHYLDYDDTHAGVRGHPSAPILSALLAVSDGDTMGDEFLRAYIIGVEMMARLGESVNPYHYLHGWHATGTFGAIAAAAAIGALKHLPNTRLAQVLGIAATQSAGLRFQVGTAVKPLHAGLAARAAVFAYEAVEEAGIAGSTELFNEANGYFRVYGTANPDIAKWKQTWGKPWRIVSPGLWFKRYTFCSAAMQGADAAQSLYHAHRFKASDIARIDVFFPKNGDSALLVRAPQTGEEGRFCIEYIVWLALTGQPLERAAFAPTPIPEKTRAELLKVQRNYDDPEWQASENAQPKGRYTAVKVTTRSGKIYSTIVDQPKGSPANPLSQLEHQTKLSQASENATDITALINRLEHEPLGPLIRLIN